MVGPPSADKRWKKERRWSRCGIEETKEKRTAGEGAVVEESEALATSTAERVELSAKEPDKKGLGMAN